MPRLRVDRHRLNGGWPQQGPGGDDLLPSPASQVEEIGSRFSWSTAAGIHFFGQMQEPVLISVSRRKLK